MSTWKVKEIQDESLVIPGTDAFIYAVLSNSEVGEIALNFSMDREQGFRCTSLEIDLKAGDLSINSIFLRELNIGKLTDVVLSEARKRSHRYTDFKDLVIAYKSLNWSKRGKMPLPDINYVFIAKMYEFFSGLGSKSILTDMKSILGNIESETIKKRIFEARRRGFLVNRKGTVGRNTQGLVTDMGQEIWNDYLWSLIMSKERKRGGKTKKQDSRNRKAG